MTALRHIRRSDFLRPSVHTTNAIAALVVVQIIHPVPEIVLALLGAATLIFVGVLDGLRNGLRALHEYTRWPRLAWIERAHNWALRRGFLKPHEMRGITAQSHYALGIGLPYLCFYLFGFPSEAVALDAAIILGFGDAAAAVYGKAWKRKYGGNSEQKTWAGFRAFCIVAFVALLVSDALQILGVGYPIYSAPWSQVIAGQFVACVVLGYVEFRDWTGTHDNFAIPVMASVVLVPFF